MLLLLPCVDGGASGEASSRGWTLSLPLGTAGRMGAAHPLPSEHGGCRP